MDLATSLLLQNWGFEDLIEAFRVECVDHDALLSLAPESKEIEQLIPKIGLRAKFQKALQTYQMIMSGQLDIQPSETSDTLSMASSDLMKDEEPTREKSDTDRIILKPDEAIPFTTLTPSATDDQIMPRQITGLQTIELSSAPLNLDIDPQQIKTNIVCVADSISNVKQDEQVDKLKNIGDPPKSILYGGIEALDLERLINETIVGRVVLSTYKMKNCLDDPARRKLVDIVITSLLSKVDELHQPITLRNPQFAVLAAKIVTLFPTEILEVYYVGPKSEGPKQKISKGKLVDAYRNRLRQMRKVGLVDIKKRKAATQDLSQEIDEESKRSCMAHRDWLQHNTTPWSSVIEHWNGSRTLRRHNFQNCSRDVNALFDEWPILKQPLGYTLIESDYDEMFCSDGLSLYSGWPELREKLQKLIETDVKGKTYSSLLTELKNDDTTPDSRDAIVLTLLPVICPFSSPIHTPKCLWKPTIAESISGFILHVKTPGDLEMAREQQQKKVASMKLPLQPYIIVVGSRLGAIEQSYVNIDNTLYAVESPLKAVDICYKAFHVLDAKYPVESEQVWLFLQTYIYKRTTKWDKKIKSVMLLARNLKEN